MSVNFSQLRDYVVVPSLEQLGLYSLAAEQLVLGTIAQESRGAYLKQVGNGPALGLIQMEPATHKDLWVNFIKYHAQMRQVLLMMLSDSASKGYKENGWPDHGDLIWNLRYAVAMCRVHYYRKPSALPQVNDVRALGEYWKTHYNTLHGAGTLDEFIHNFPYDLYGLQKENGE